VHAVEVEATVLMGAITVVSTWREDDVDLRGGVEECAMAISAAMRW
jgi:hypothetical protein